jgi:hypothetical protein
MIHPGTFETITRAGFAARGIIYCLIGYLALQLDRAEDPAGALGHLATGSGRALLLVMAAGLGGYGCWRLAEAVVDSEGHGDGAKGIAVRLGGAASGIIHLLLALYAAALGMDSAGGGGGDAAREGARAALDLPGGSVILTVLAAALVATGIYQLVEAARARFLKHLDWRAAKRAWVEWIGRAGYAARGIVFLIVGWFLVRAAIDRSPGEAGGMDSALDSLPDDLRWPVATGLLLFGVSSLVAARYRRITDPHVLARLRGKLGQVTR